MQTSDNKESTPEEQTQDPIVEGPTQQPSVEEQTPSTTQEQSQIEPTGQESQPVPTSQEQLQVPTVEEPTQLPTTQEQTQIQPNSPQQIEPTTQEQEQPQSITQEQSEPTNQEQTQKATPEKQTQVEPVTQEECPQPTVQEHSQIESSAQGQTLPITQEQSQPTLPEYTQQSITQEQHQIESTPPKESQIEPTVQEQSPAPEVQPGSQTQDVDEGNLEANLQSQSMDLDPSMQGSIPEKVVTSDQTNADETPAANEEVKSHLEESSVLQEPEDKTTNETSETSVESVSVPSENLQEDNVEMPQEDNKIESIANIDTAATTDKSDVGQLIDTKLLSDVTEPKNGDTGVTGNTVESTPVSNSDTQMKDHVDDIIDTTEETEMDTSESNIAYTTEKNGMDTAENNELDTTEKNEIDTSENNELDTTEKNDIDTSENNELDTTEKNEMDTAEIDQMDTMEKNETDAAKTTAGDSENQVESSTSNTDVITAIQADLILSSHQLDTSLSEVNSNCKEPSVEQTTSAKDQSEMDTDDSVNKEVESSEKDSAVVESVDNMAVEAMDTRTINSYDKQDSISVDTGNESLVAQSIDESSSKNLQEPVESVSSEDISNQEIATIQQSKDNESTKTDNLEVIVTQDIDQGEPNPDKDLLETKEKEEEVGEPTEDLSSIESKDQQSVQETVACDTENELAKDVCNTSSISEENYEEDTKEQSQASPEKSAEGIEQDSNAEQLPENSGEDMSKSDEGTGVDSITENLTEGTTEDILDQQLSLSESTPNEEATECITADMEKDSTGDDSHSNVQETPESQAVVEDNDEPPNDSQAILTEEQKDSVNQDMSKMDTSDQVSTDIQPSNQGSSSSDAAPVTTEKEEILAEEPLEVAEIAQEEAQDFTVTHSLQNPAQFSHDPAQSLHDPTQASQDPKVARESEVPGTSSEFGDGKDALPSETHESESMIAKPEETEILGMENPQASPDDTEAPEVSAETEKEILSEALECSITDSAATEPDLLLQYNKSNTETVPSLDTAQNEEHQEMEVSETMDSTLPDMSENSLGFSVQSQPQESAETMNASDMDTETMLESQETVTEDNAEKNEDSAEVSIEEGSDDIPSIEMDGSVNKEQKIQDSSENVEEAIQSQKIAGSSYEIATDLSMGNSQISSQVIAASEINSQIKETEENQASQLIDAADSSNDNSGLLVIDEGDAEDKEEGSKALSVTDTSPTDLSVMSTTQELGGAPVDLAVPKASHEDVTPTPQIPQEATNLVVYGASEQPTSASVSTNEPSPSASVSISEPSPSISVSTSVIMKTPTTTSESATTAANSSTGDAPENADGKSSTVQVSPDLQSSMDKVKAAALKQQQTKRDVGWTTIEGVLVPYLSRGTTKYVSVKMVENKMLSKYPSIDLDDMKDAGPIYSYYVTDDEAKLLTEINAKCYKHAFGTDPFTVQDLIVSLGDFQNFYKNIRRHFEHLEKEKQAKEAVAKEALARQKTAQEKRQADQRSKSRKQAVGGNWIQINNTVCPYIQRGDLKLVPISVIRFAARLLLGKDYSAHKVAITPIEIQTLNMLCKNAGVNFLFDINNTRLIRVEAVCQLMHPEPVSIRVLTKKHPFEAAVYHENLEKSHNGIPNGTQTSSAIKVSQSTSKTTPVSQQAVPGSRPLNPQENPALLQLRQMVTSHTQQQSKAGTAQASISTMSTTMPPASSFTLQGTPPAPPPPRSVHAPLPPPQPITIAPIDSRHIPGAPSGVKQQQQQQDTPRSIQSSHSGRPTGLTTSAGEPLIKPVRLSGKTVSCILRPTTGERYALVEALARLYFPQCTLQEFQKALQDLLRIPLEELTPVEEQEFINFYDLPVRSLKCKTIAPIRSFEAFFQHLKYLFKDKKASPKTSPSSHPPNPAHTTPPSAHQSQHSTSSSHPRGTTPTPSEGSRSSTPSEGSGPTKRPASADSSGSAGPSKKPRTGPGHAAPQKKLGNVLAKLKERQEHQLAKP